LVLAAVCGGTAQAQVGSVSAWDASEFRIWGFVPYWTSTSTLNAFPADGVYTHVSDVLYFGGDVTPVPFHHASHNSCDPATLEV
jgi:hypothetical protein